jgi:hypothetical protein
MRVFETKVVNIPVLYIPNDTAVIERRFAERLDEFIDELTNTSGISLTRGFGPETNGQS